MEEDGEGTEEGGMGKSAEELQRRTWEMVDGAGQTVVEHSGNCWTPSSGQDGNYERLPKKRLTEKSGLINELADSLC